METFRVYIRKLSVWFLNYQYILIGVFLNAYWVRKHYTFSTSEKGSTLRDLLPREANSFLLEKTLFKKDFLYMKVNRQSQTL